MTEPALSPEENNEFRTSMREWMAQREEQDERLYEVYGGPLEEEHTGEYLAISDDGETILNTDPDELLREAVATFGRGNFALARVGDKAFGEWLSFSQ